MSKTFTAQKLADLATGLTSLAKAWDQAVSSIEDQPFEQLKEAKNVIDLSVLIGSGIDCEFKDDIDKHITIGPLLEIKDDDWDMYPYTAGNSADKYYAQCQPRMKHKHPWLHNKCPIEGFVVRAWDVKENFLTVHTSSNNIDWSKIMHIEFLEVEHGYVMPWEQDNAK